MTAQHAGSTVRRYFLVMVALGFIGLIIGGLNVAAAQWSWLVWIIPAGLLLGGLLVLARRARR